jgi:hypothetical protein
MSLLGLANGGIVVLVVRVAPMAGLIGFATGPGVRRNSAAGSEADNRLGAIDGKDGWIRVGPLSDGEWEPNVRSRADG